MTKNEHAIDLIIGRMHYIRALGEPPRWWRLRLSRQWRTAYRLVMAEHRCSSACEVTG